MEEKVYHGSPQPNVKILNKRKSTHMVECVYATNNSTIALLFMAKGNGDLDKSLDICDGEITLVERRPGVLKKLYSSKGYLYELNSKNFNHYDFLWSPEVISYYDEETIGCEEINNIYEELMKRQEMGMIKVCEYPERPKYIPLDNSDLIEKYLNFQERGRKNAIADLLEIYPEFEERVNKSKKI